MNVGGEILMDEDSPRSSKPQMLRPGAQDLGGGGWAVTATARMAEMMVAFILSVIGVEILQSVFVGCELL